LENNLKEEKKFLDFIKKKKGQTSNERMKQQTSSELFSERMKKNAIKKKEVITNENNEIKVAITCEFICSLFLIL